MPTGIDNWRSTTLTLFAAVLGLVFLLADSASACPHHMAAKKPADAATAHQERMSVSPATKAKTNDHASHSTRETRRTAVECPHRLHGGIYDCSTCCGIGSTNAQRPQDIALVDLAPADSSVPDIPVTTLSPATSTAAEPFPDRQSDSSLGQNGKTRLVSISRRLRL